MFVQEILIIILGPLNLTAMGRWPLYTGDRNDRFHCTTKPIAAFSCTPRVQEEHTKAEVVHLTPGVLGLGVLFNCHA